MNRAKVMAGIAVAAMGMSASASESPLPKYAPNREITGAYDKSAAAVCANGTFVGERTGDVIAYRGIPYAQQPVGRLRWKAPLDPLPSKKVYEAVHFGKSCLQPPDHGEKASLYEQGEDCLTLCVYRNTSDPTPGKPVMMFIHGGGYCLGGTCDPTYDGRNFVAQNPDVILVVITYRFGMMGYINFSQLPDGAAYADSVNLAQLDQIAALKWLKGNAAAFGGDPERITIFGESAGGGSVSSLIVSPEARKYFRRAIPMSGVANYVQGMNDGQRLTRALMEKFGAKSVADLVKVDFDAFREFWNEDATKYYNIPTANGTILPLDPVAAWADPALKGIEVLQGVTRNEWRYFLSVYAYDLDFFNVINRTMYEMLAEGASDEYRADAARLMKVLEKEYGKDWAPAEFVSGRCFRAGQFFQALSHAKNGGREFMYRIDKLNEGPYGKLRGADHGIELPYLFGNFDEDAPDNEANRRYARMLQRMWVSFAKTGNPSIPGVEWPAFDDRTRKVMILAEEGPRVEENPEAERTELEQRLLKNPNYKFVKGLAPVHERIIARDGSAQFEAVMRKMAELAEETRGTGQRFTREELAYMPATVQIELYKAGYITPSDVLEAQIARVKEFNGEYNTARRDLLKELETFNAGKVNAITFDNFAEARKMAKEATLRYRNGTARRLEGVTVGVKNDCDVKGWRSDTGSLFKKDIEPSEADEDFIARLRAEGAIFLFQTTVPEFCASCMTWSRLYGVTRNPWNLPYGVGGSSGGSGASLASGFCTLATGSDMGGSIRIPASMNGVYGFKPPFGRIPIDSESPFMGYGPLARTFADMVLMQDVMTGPADGVHCALRPKLDYPTEYAPITGVKVAVAYMEDWLPGGCDADVVKALDETVKLLKRSGAEVVKVRLGWKSSELMPIYVRGLLTDSCATALGGFLDKKDQFCANLAAFIDHIDEASPAAVGEIHALQGRLVKQLSAEVFSKGCLALVMPTLSTAHVPADIDSTPEKKADVNGKKYGGLDFCLTSIFNAINNYPIVTVPVALSSKNVPIGMQVIGNTYDDLAAMRVSAALSKVVPQNFRDGRFPDFRNQK